MAYIPDPAHLVLKETQFTQMMSRHIYNILLVATHYDSFVLEEDGRIEEEIYNEYISLGLSSPPRFTQVCSEKEALELLEERHFELIIIMPNMDRKNIFEAAQAIKERYPNIPIVVLSPFSKELSRHIAESDTTSIDYTFCWMGDARLILTIVKLLEDKMNAPEDTENTAVQIILLVEDSVRFYSSTLPHLYQFVLEQSLEFAKETLNNHQKNLRMRGRPKIMLARNYEEAVEIYDRYHHHMLGIISDMSINFGANKDPYAGFKFGQYVRERDSIVPFILESSDKANSTYAQKIHATFIHKSSKNYPHELRHNVSDLFGFGRFRIINPETGKILMEIANLKDLQNKIFDIPDNALAYHLSQDHFSRFFYSRAMFAPAEILKYIAVNDYENMEQARQLIFQLIVLYRHQKNEGTIAVYQRDRFDQYSKFARIGNDSLGGKGRGIAFLGAMLKRHPNLNSPNLSVTIPKTVVVCADIFDQFMEQNNLSAIALSDASDEDILQAFLQATLPDELYEDIAALAQVFKGAVAIRSSSLLEDSHYQPFAGVYATYMVPLVGDKPQVIAAVANAVKSVYASTFFNESKTYMRATGNLIEQEKMSVILQEVVGQVYEGRLYPSISGVARSLNYYPIDPLKSEDGICDLALGLGKYIVDGGKTLHFSPVHPQKIMQLSTVDSALRDTQTQFYALPLSQIPTFSTDDGFNIQKLTLRDAAHDGSLRLITSTYEPQSQMIYDGYYETGRPIISFSNLLYHNVIPLASTLHQLLEIGEQEMGRPVEMEFAINLDQQGKSAEFFLLQIRPIVDPGNHQNLDFNQFRSEDILLQSDNVLGHGTITGLKSFLYVKPQTHTPAINEQLAEEIRSLNATQSKEGNNYVLIGPGRWGSSDSWLGIPVKWTDISSASVIIEISPASVDPSQGTHFFHNLTSLGIGYFTLSGSNHPYQADNLFQWLDAQPAQYESEHLRLVSLPECITIHLDGRHSRGVILKPQSQE